MAARKKVAPLEIVTPHAQPNSQPDVKQVVRKRVKQEAGYRFYTVKMLIVVFGLGVFSLMFLELYMSSQINHVHYEIQRVQRDINQGVLMNDQLNAEISRQSQHSRIIEIATRHGLTFNEENVINISR